MGKQLSMDHLPEGIRAQVVEVGGEGAMRRRLLDLGLIPGTWVTCRGRAPAGEPGAFALRGCVGGLRPKEVSPVALEPEGVL